MRVLDSSRRADRWRRGAIKGLGVALALACTLTFASCASSSDDKKTDTGTADKSPIKVGLIASQTGVTAFLAAAGKAFNARLELENANGGIDGHPLQAVIADDTSSGDGALTAARSLIQDDKVQILGDASIWIYGAAQYVTGENVPVVGWGTDGPHWSAPPFFAIEGSADPKVPATTTKPAFLKSQGCTNLGLLGLGGTPSALAGLTGLQVAAESIGLKVGYLNGSIPFTTTDYTTDILAMKSAGVDCVIANFALQGVISIAKGIKQAGMPMKHLLSVIGYGEPDLLKDKAAIDALQGSFFDVRFAPFELETEATKSYADALEKYEGITGDVSAVVTSGWAAADLIIEAYKKAGPDATSAQLLDALKGITSWDAGGLLPKAIDWTSDFGTEDGSLGPGRCTWFTQLTGDKFDVVDGPDATCGEALPNSNQVG